MLLLRELLALREYQLSHTIKGFDLWQGVRSKIDGLDDADVEVTYNYEPPDYTDHPYGEGSAREHHPAEIDVQHVVLLHDINQTDEDGKVIKTFAKGTELLDEPWWDKEWTEWIVDKIAEDGGSSDDDFDPPDRDDGHDDPGPYAHDFYGHHR